MPNFDPDPIQIHDGAKPKTQTTKGVPIPPPRSLTPMSPVINMTPSRVLASIPEGHDVDRIETLRRKYRKALKTTPTEGIDVGGSEEVLDPQIRIPDQSDFELPSPLQDFVDPSKVTHKFLPKQGEIDRLINQINKKV